MNAIIEADRREYPAEELPKILCVDDDPFILKTLMRFFRRDKLEILTADSAEEGLVLFRRHPPVRIVIADFRMPGMNGLDFLRQVRHESPETVNILISGYAEPSAVSAALEDRLIFRFLPKPWYRAELRKIINEALGQAENSCCVSESGTFS